MRRTILFAVSLCCAPVLAEAQHDAMHNDAVTAMRDLWKSMTDYITTAAQDVPESMYGYRPVATVRTFGQIIGHVAGAQYLMCAAALGDPPRAEDEIEKSVTTKAGLVAALKASSEYCAKAYAQADEAAHGKTMLFGQEHSRLFALGMNATHNGEHYGNIVTYMRMNKMVPPSSRQP